MLNIKKSYLIFFTHTFPCFFKKYIEKAAYIFFICKTPHFPGYHKNAKRSFIIFSWTIKKLYGCFTFNTHSFSASSFRIQQFFFEKKNFSYIFTLEHTVPDHYTHPNCDPNYPVTKYTIFSLKMARRHIALCPSTGCSINHLPPPRPPPIPHSRVFPIKFLSLSTRAIVD